MPTSSIQIQSAATGARPRLQSRGFRLPILISACFALASVPGTSVGQSTASSLTSRAELTAAAANAELAAATGNGGDRTRNAMQAAAIRQRLLDGDFQVGERIVLTIVSDAAHTDTLVVRAGRVIDLPGKATLSLAGVLRSELKDRVTGEVLKYVKATSVNVTPLTRIAVLGEVVRPGYFAFASDAPLTDAIMVAGGPTATADLERSFVRRASREYRSADETRHAVSNGLTLDQFGLIAGDELVVGKQRQLISPSTTAVFGAVASLAAIFLAVHR
jgi:protein involved in polysaccharide export with SLBB domain